MTTEADARIVIDQLLKEAGWTITNKAQVSTEEPAADGRADYLLKDTRTRPLAVIEAKRFSIDPYSAKKQARAYAESLAASFVILSNGQEHYFWDYADGDARPVMGLPTQTDLQGRFSFDSNDGNPLTTDILAGQTAATAATRVLTPESSPATRGVRSTSRMSSPSTAAT